ncbi:hypothetical protein MJO29_013987 [Puccinia striiformis f. sp. tritici]|nr:hypothetical protein MJO29_013987 [Puccinia striiformis f. sp. tritici]
MIRKRKKQSHKGSCGLPEHLAFDLIQHLSYRFEIFYYDFLGPLAEFPPAVFFGINKAKIIVDSFDQIRAGVFHNTSLLDKLIGGQCFEGQIACLDQAITDWMGGELYQHHLIYMAELDRFIEAEGKRVRDEMAEKYIILQAKAEASRQAIQLAKEVAAAEEKSRKAEARATERLRVAEDCAKEKAMIAAERAAERQHVAEQKKATKALEKAHRKAEQVAEKARAKETAAATKKAQAKETATATETAALEETAAAGKATTETEAAAAAATDTERVDNVHGLLDQTGLPTCFDKGDNTGYLLQSDLDMRADKDNGTTKEQIRGKGRAAAERERRLVARQLAQARATNRLDNNEKRDTRSNKRSRASEDSREIEFLKKEGVRLRREARESKRETVQAKREDQGREHIAKVMRKSQNNAIMDEVRAELAEGARDRGEGNSQSHSATSS